MVPALLIAKSLWADVRAKVGRDKSFLATIIDDYYHKKNVDERIIDPSRNQVHNVMNAATKEKGKFLSIGNTDTIPSLEDARNRCFELSFNVPVQFEKGFKTLTFRVRNLTEGEKVVWVEGSDGILPRQSGCSNHYSYRRRR